MASFTIVAVISDFRKPSGEQSTEGTTQRSRAVEHSQSKEQFMSAVEPALWSGEFFVKDQAAHIDR